MDSPYQNLPRRAFWRTAVGEQAADDPGDLYRPRWKLDPQERVFTAGSCFAQHVGGALRAANVRVIDTEVLPFNLSKSFKNTYGYGLFAARFGNIYTSRQMLQLIRETTGEISPALSIWEQDDRFFDAQRPSVEPRGLETPEQVRTHREFHLRCVKDALDRTQVFVFTFGLTETWEHIDSGTVYPTAPGVLAGHFDPELFQFKNLSAVECYRDFVAIRARMKELKPKCKFIVTVSPVPLTATASGEHVEVATARSKASLRAACAMLVDEFEDVDYFPSYEIITSANSKGVYFEENKRSVTKAGVDLAMNMFLSAHDLTRQSETSPDIHNVGAEFCEDVLLEAFAQ